LFGYYWQLKKIISSCLNITKILLELLANLALDNILKSLKINKNVNYKLKIYFCSVQSERETNSCFACHLHGQKKSLRNRLFLF
jgi:hypothetical protein